MRTLFLFGVVLSLLAAPVLADEIVLKDGRRLYGEVQQEDGHTVVVDSFGNSVVLTDEVKTIKGPEQLREEYKSRTQQLDVSRNHLSLGLWCWRRGLKEEAKVHFGAVLEKDPENRAARWALGEVKVKGIWVKAGVWTALPNEKKTWVRWMPKGGKGKLQVRQGEAPNDARDLIRKALRGTPEERKQARSTYNALRASERKEGLLFALTDRSERVRTFAAEELKAFKGKKVAKALARSALVDRARKVRRRAAQSIAEGKFPTGRHLLMEGLCSPHFSVRLNAIDAMPFVPADDSMNALVSVMSSGAPRIPRVNIFVGSTTAYVRDFDVEVASFAGIGDPVMAHAMEGSVLDVKVLAISIRRVRVQQSAALRSLVRVAGKNFGKDAAVWRKWISEKYGKG